MHFLSEPFIKLILFWKFIYLILLLNYQIIAAEKNTEVCVEKSFLEHAQSEE